MKDLMVRMSSEHTTVVAIAAAVVVVALVVALYYVNHYKKLSSTQNFLGMHPNPWGGFGHAGMGGSIDRPTTKYQLAATHPGHPHNMGHIHSSDAGFSMMSGKMEGLAPSPVIGAGGGMIGGNGTITPMCGRGQVAVSYSDPSGTTLTHCVDGGMVSATGCGRPWDPAAIAEAQALATVGSYQHDSYGEAALQSVINQAYDSDRGISDDQLSTLMQHGGMP